MIYLQLPDNLHKKLPFYLAMEEYAASLPSIANDDLFFMWRVDPTVIYGRCQIGSREINPNYCRENNIEVYRRKSGGGCVYADRDNIMFSYITKRVDATHTIFTDYTTKIAAFLQTLGLNASATSRNDILVDGKKVSGNAFYNCKGTSIVHGTMLYNTNIAHMINALTPSKAKISAKGITSVESRITTLNRYLDFSIEEFMQIAKNHLCDSTYAISDEEISLIENISQPYFTDEWRYGLDLKKRTLSSKRIEGVGEFYINTTVANNKIIKDIDIAGDFFILGDITRQLITPLLGVEYSRKEITDALNNIKVNEIISGLTNDEYINLLIESNHE